MKVKIEHDSITPKIKKLGEQLKEPLLKAIGNIALREVMENFRSQGQNLGKRWVPLAKLTRAWRRTGAGSGSDQALLNTPNLMMSIKQVLRLPNKVDIQSNYRKGDVDIAAVQNFGVKPYTPSKEQIAWFRYRGVYLKKDTKMHIPARLFMALSKVGITEIAGLPARMVRDL
jgi:phage gpG-like protein